MKDRIQEIKERLNAATPGPWVKITNGSLRYIAQLIDDYHKPPLESTEHNVEFIANAPEDIYYLLSRLEQSEKRAEAAVEDWGLAVECAGSLLACDACNHLKYDIVDGRYCELKSCKSEWRGPIGGE